ncbi:hypothetical protein OG788_29085 [Streptomyces sp. NBC_00647]|uniref:hypothetical protein n=1 Tax=Streptomyces sp. NBC_00647 TaxID=2975796 RepID=UPI00324B4A6E
MPGNAGHRRTVAPWPPTCAEPCCPTESYAASGTGTAVGAASRTARAFLGLPAVAEGAPADITVYDADPREEPAVLRHPRRIMLRGRIIR